MQARRQTLFTLIALTIALFGVIVAVYHQLYELYQNRIIKDGDKWGAHVEEMFLNNISSIEEDLTLFTISTHLDTSSDLHETSITDDLLLQRFISFFETQYGYKVYEEVTLTDAEGCVVASTKADVGSCGSKDWWIEAVEVGKSYRFISDKTGRAMLLIAIRVGSRTKPAGVLYGEFYISSMIKEAGHFESFHMKKLELLNEDWQLLYSTSLHKAFENKENLKHQLSGTHILGNVHQLNKGRKEILITQKHIANPQTPISWILVLTLDNEDLLKPVYTMRRWIIGGIISLMLMVSISLYLIKHLYTKEYRERELKKNLQILESILNGIEAGIIFIDKDNHTISHMSDIAKKLIGADAQELIGKPCHKYLCRPGHDFAQKGCPANDKDIIHTEFELRRLDGTTIPVTKTVLEVPFNDKAHLVAVLFDITKRKDIERQLAHALKLESIGSLAAGIAHEINTPAQYINDNLKFIRKAFKSCVDYWEQQSICEREPRSLTEDVKFYLDEIPPALEQSLEGINNITKTVQALKKLSHPGVDLYEMSDINSILENVSIVCRNEWKYSSNLDFQLMDSLPLVRCNTHDISQLFLNLIVNASHAVSLRHSKLHQKGLIQIRSTTDGDDVVIEVEDNGIGIPANLREKVYDPFFTTKDIGQGSGQGLSIAYAIVQKHQGTIELTSEENVGTKFKIRLPINPVGGGR